LRTIGIATEPIDGGGRSYDAVMREGTLPDDIARELIDRDPFGPDEGQLI
jgi:hypothetical protein